jgi:serine phosphatase RsbU (regulator of sigma subunit)/DNA-binding GntR family transcriptional regulator
MFLLHHGENEASAWAARNDPAGKFARVRLAGELSNGHCRAGSPVRLSEIAAKFQLDQDSVLKIFAEFQALGMVTLSGNVSAVVRSPCPKEMQEAYEIRAALEEIGGRAATRVLKGNTSELQRELEAMRVAFGSLDLDSFVEHDVTFHRRILQASGNEVLLRVWDSLAVDLRIRGAIEWVSRDFPEVVESHQPIVDALEKGRGREAGLLLRNHVETLLEVLKKSESDSGFHTALTRDLENARAVQRAFFPQENLSIPGLACETFYKPAQGIGGDYYDFFPLQANRWGIAIGDICGKGIGAALLMASLQASLRAQAMHAHSDPSALIADVDRLVHAASPKHLYASLFYAEYDPATRLLRYVNAGHNAPIVLRWKHSQCEVFHLEASGTPLGLLDGSVFISKSFQLEIGDVLVMYTDGITEAENPERELWGQNRLESLLRSCRGDTPPQIVRRILDEMSAFANGLSQRDDMTLMVIGVKDVTDPQLINTWGMSRSPAVRGG